MLRSEWPFIIIIMQRRTWSFFAPSPLKFYLVKDSPCISLIMTVLIHAGDVFSTQFFIWIHIEGAFFPYINLLTHLDGGDILI